MKQKFYIDAKVEKIDNNIKKAIKKAGITYPHHSLAFFKATYAKFEEANGNKVILADSVKKDVKYLIGTQMNYNHERYGAIMGSIIDAYITDDDEIEIVFTFAKTVYSKEYELALELMKEGKLTVSFELMVANKDVENLSGGNRRLKRVEFDGVGLLFAVKPAYKNAFVLETAMQIIEDAFKQKDKQLVYASAKDITKKWTRIGELIEKALIEKEEASYKCECVECGNIISSSEHCKDIKCSKCGGEMRRYDRPSKEKSEQELYKYSLENKEKGDSMMDKKAQEALLAEFKKDVIAELGEEAVKDWSEEQWEAELTKRAKAEDKTEPETTEASKSEAEESKEEEANEETDSEEKAEEKEESEKEDEKAESDENESSEEKAEVVKVEEETKVKTTNEYDSETKEEKRTTEAESTVKVNDEITQVRKQLDEVLFKYAELEKVVEEKDKEIAFLKDNAQKIVEIRAELGDFVKDFSDEELFDETKIENARLKKRVDDLENKNIETANDKEENAEAEEKDEDLKTGHEEKEQKEEETADERVEQYLKNNYGNKK